MYDTLKYNHLEILSRKKQYTKDDVYHKKICNTSSVKIYVEPPPIVLIKNKKYAKFGNYCAKFKFCTDPTSENSKLYEFIMPLFDNINPKEFLLFVPNFQMMLKYSIVIAASTRIQYLCMILSDEYLRQLSTLAVK